LYAAASLKRDRKPKKEKKKPRPKDIPKVEGLGVSVQGFRVLGFRV
jgi:hypothetical protein